MKTALNRPGWKKEPNFPLAGARIDGNTSVRLSTPYDTLKVSR
jgi:hypothetical protein